MDKRTSSDGLQGFVYLVRDEKMTTDHAIDRLGKLFHDCRLVDANGGPAREHCFEVCTGIVDALDRLDGTTSEKLPSVDEVWRFVDASIVRRASFYRDGPICTLGDRLKCSLDRPVISKTSLADFSSIAVNRGQRICDRFRGGESVQYVAAKRRAPTGTSRCLSLDSPAAKIHVVISFQRIAVRRQIAEVLCCDDLHTNRGVQTITFHQTGRSLGDDDALVLVGRVSVLGVRYARSGRGFLGYESA